MNKLAFSEESIAELQKKSKERTVRTQNIDYDVESLVKNLQDGRIKLDPEYQRNHRWKDATSSKLIESLILNIPIPLIYISYDVDLDIETSTEEVRYSVIDGQQRLRAILNYFNNEYELKDLDTLKEIVGRKFNELPPFLQRRLQARTIRCLQIDSTVDEQIKYDIFERLNTGSVKLEAQEIRNATIRGYINEKLKELSKLKEFKKLIQVAVDEKKSDLDEPAKTKPEPTRVSKMEDRELVLRFMTLSQNYFSEEMSQGMGRFLTKKMKDFNAQPNSEIDVLGEDFKEVMKIILQSFGPRAFGKQALNEQELKYVSNFNVAVFDALSQAVFYNYKAGKRKYTRSDVKNFEAVFKSEEFYATITYGINDRAKIKNRIDTVIKAIR